MPKELEIGDEAPEFELRTDTEETVRLSDYRGQRVILYFYPKDDTPGCTTQACGFRDRYPQIEERNAVVLGVSPDDAASHTRFKTKYNLPFTLLVDDGGRVAQQYGVWKEKMLFGKPKMGVIRSHFVIDEEGRIADAQVNIKPENSVEKAVASIEAV